MADLKLRDADGRPVSVRCPVCGRGDAPRKGDKVGRHNPVRRNAHGWPVTPLTERCDGEGREPGAPEPYYGDGELVEVFGPPERPFLLTLPDRWPLRTGPSR